VSGAYAERPAAGLDATTWWSSTADGDVLVLPDGCIDVLWIDGELVVAGPDRRARRHHGRPGAEVGGVRLHPGVAPALLGVSAQELVDRTVPLDQLWRSGPARRAIDAVGCAAPGAERAAAVEALLRGLEPVELDPRAAWVADRLRAGASVAAVADELGWGERRLQRAALRWYGYGAKHLARVLRLQRALAGARTGTTLAAVAADAGYADQPHLARDVRDLTGARMLDLVAATPG
jgi:AraC-like DNA-binding protein